MQFSGVTSAATVGASQVLCRVRRRRSSGGLPANHRSRAARAASIRKSGERGALYNIVLTPPAVRALSYGGEWTTVTLRPAAIRTTGDESPPPPTRNAGTRTDTRAR